MNKGISFQGFVPIRQDPSESVPMVSQVLFGETFNILSTNEDWLRISLDFDGQEGWVSKDLVELINPENEAQNSLPSPLHMVIAPAIKAYDKLHARQLILPAGTLCPARDHQIDLFGRSFTISEPEGLGEVGAVDPIKTGMGLLSLPMLEGGRCGFGFDAPGLVQSLSRMLGINIPRESHTQAELGEAVNFIHEIQLGDLAFFDGPDGQINHVGMVLDQGKILHVVDQVRMDKLDQQGIYNLDKEKYTHRLRIIKRLKNG